MKNITRTTALAAALLPLLACTPTSAPDDQIDLIVDGQTVVTMDAAGTVIENGAVAIDDGIIIAIGPSVQPAVSPDFRLFLSMN